MELQLFKGRPETSDGRLDREIRCYDMLDSLGLDRLHTRLVEHSRSYERQGR